jgi:DNA-binding transcriptional MocR family regulator
VLRVGSICASASLLPELVRVKMLTGLTTSEVNERAVHHAITARPYRRMVEKLAAQLEAGRARSEEALREVGMTPVARPRGGMFVSAGWDVAPTPAWNGRVIADQALRAGILLAPNEFFMLRPSSTIWFRFNVAYTDQPQLRNFLQSIRNSHG